MPYFLSKAALELPITFIQCICQYLLAYFLCGLQGNFILMVLIAWCLGLASASIATMIGCLVPDVGTVTELVPLLTIPQMLFAGFFIRTKQIPIYLRWAQYLCGLKYAMNLMLIVEFDPSLPSCQGNMAQVLCKGIITTNDIDRSHWWVYMLLLLLLIMCFRTLAAYFLQLRAKKFFM